MGLLLVSEVVMSLQKILVKIRLTADVAHNAGATFQRLVVDGGDVLVQRRLLREDLATFPFRASTKK